MAFGCVIVVLADFKSVQTYCGLPYSQQKLVQCSVHEGSGARLFCLLCMQFLNYLLITLILQVAPPKFFTIGASWTIMIPPITANHLLINMEYSCFANTSTGTTINANTFSSVEFNDGVESTPSSV
ncbi:hypothetical protein AZE42_12016 [Rhizopogon vesiculosus]|uniref:Uncharacterized protein n=1 Tax=Rhizopogon vesiculosus TaxID=180088 RepID=A0A1J8QDY3_9AGAM|nr:hypothetical protein AZE42_12016 [Rhizopogon vesiculosus]